MYASPIYARFVNPFLENPGNPDQVIRFTRHPGKVILELIFRTEKAKLNLTRSDKC